MPAPRITIYKTVKGFIESFEKPLTYLSVVAALATSYFLLIEWRVGQIVKDPAFIAGIARLVRPAVVFNADGTILTDSGAMELLDGAPLVTMSERNDALKLATITIHPKRLLAEPILESLDLSNVSVSAKRGRGFSWEITVVSRWESITSELNPSAIVPPRFRLELSAQ